LSDFYFFFSFLLANACSLQITAQSGEDPSPPTFIPHEAWCRRVARLLVPIAEQPGFCPASGGPFLFPSTAPVTINGGY
jgi:hypothetical protein